MRLVRAIVASILLCALSIINVSAKTEVNPPPVEPVSQKPPIVITSLGGSGGLDFVELYNQHDAPIDVTGWSVRYVVRDGSQASEQHTIQLPTLAGWLLPEKYVSYIQDDEAAHGISFEADVLLKKLRQPEITEVTLIDAQQAIKQRVQLEKPLATDEWLQHKQRGKATITDTQSAKDYKRMTGPADIYSEPLYKPAGDVGGLALVEVLANPRACGPLEIGVECQDYIKVHNNSTETVDLSHYRLRTGYKGQTASPSTTFTWNKVPGDAELPLAPGEYMTVSLRADDKSLLQPLSLTNGGHVWLEDSLGVTLYPASVVEYPELDKGISWAYDVMTAQWRQGQPQPHGQNVFAIPQAEASESAMECESGYIRNTTTNRCRKVVASVENASCKPGQERHPETGRCRTSVTAAATPAPCEPGSVRHPETNRCRKEVAAENQPAPCQPGQERNLETNRCRKITAPTHQAATIKDTLPPQQNAVMAWGIAGIVVAGALGYAVYEWRHPLVAAGRRFVAIFRRPPSR